MRIALVGIPVRDQAKALAFYTEKLDFVKKHDIDVGGGNRWLTVVASEDPDGPEVSLEPAPLHFEPSKVFQEALYSAGIPYTQFNVDDLQGTYDRLTAKGVIFRSEPKASDQSKYVMLDDTCGNYIMLVEML